MPRGRARSAPVMAGAFGSQGDGLEAVAQAQEVARLQVEAVMVRFLAAWMAGDARDLEHCLHPDLTKHLAYVGPPIAPRAAASRLQALLALFSLGPAQAGVRVDLRVLDLHGRSASVAVDLGSWFGYAHLRRTLEGWKLVNLLWEWG